MKNYIDQLNDAQKLPVLATEGPVMIIAGAGSGKTRVLTYRIAHLMQKGVDAFNILSLTFTNKAAKEMKERIGKVVGEHDAKNLWSGTFHAIFARILRVEAVRLGYPSNFTIYDMQDALSVVKKVLDELQLDKDIYKPKQVLGRISQYKNNLITVRAYFANPELIDADAAALRPKMGDVYRNYVDKCFKSGAMDFDDLLLRTNEVLTRFPEVLAKYQDRFKYIMVDEYQDTNHSQYLIVKALASRYENICVVGDDAQSIYAFRGANIRNILNFQKDYNDAQVFPLEQNYRSTQNIVKAANSIISHNKDQLKKEVWTANGQGSKIPIYRGLSDADESQFVASKIIDLRLNNQLRNKEFAILYRTNAQSRAIEESLRKRNIPYRVFGGVSFYQRKEIKDLIAYLRLLINPNDEEALLRIINYPLRSIGQTTVNKLIVGADELKLTIFSILEDIILHGPQLGFTSAVITKLNDFGIMIKSFQVMLKTNDVHQVAMHVAKASGILKTMKEDDTPEGISRLENIQELLNSLQGFVEEQQQLDEGDPSLANFLETVALTTDTDNSDPEADKVALMTVHLAKGLEFPVVFVVGLEENLFPSMLSLNDRENLEEERRLFYVAITRAEKEVILSYAITRYRWGKIIDCEPSRFLEEIDDKYLDWLNLNQQISKNNSGLNSNLFDDFSPPSKFKTKTTSPSLNQQNPIPNTPKNLKPISQVRVSGNVEGAVNLKTGDVVTHDRFGKGTIGLLEGDLDNIKATILFDHAGEKKLLLKFAKLKVLTI